MLDILLSTTGDGGGGGLSALQSTLVTNWIGPALLIIIAIFALSFLKSRQWNKLISFIGIGVVVALLVYAGGPLTNLLARNTAQLVDQGLESGNDTWGIPE